MPAIATRTDTFTVQPFATFPVDGDAAALLNAIGEALEQDARAHGPVVAYDYDRHRVDAIFQVELPVEYDGVGALPLRWTITHASEFARSIFDRALLAAGIPAHTAGISVVEGDDPDLLP